MALQQVSWLFVLLVYFLRAASCARTANPAQTPATRNADYLKGGLFESRSASSGRKLAQDSWVDPFQERLPEKSGPSSLFKRWFGSRGKNEVEYAVEEGQKRMEVVSAAMAKRAKALGKDSPLSMEDEYVSKAAAQVAARLATGGEDGASRGGRFADKETEGKGGGKLSPLERAKQKIKKEKEDLYVEGVLEEGEIGDDSEFLIVEDPSWEEGITNEFVRQYVKELQGDYEGLDDTMHFQIDRIESQIREYARAQADAVWKAWEEVVAAEKHKAGLLNNSTSVGQLPKAQTV